MVFLVLLHPSQHKMARLPVLMAHVAEAAFVAEAGFVVFGFVFAVEDEQFVALSFVVDDAFVGVTGWLAVPIEGIPFEAVLQVFQVFRFFLSDKEPDGFVAGWASRPRVPSRAC